MRRALLALPFLLVAAPGFADEAAHAHPCAGKPHDAAQACLSEMAKNEEARLEKAYENLLQLSSLDDQARALVRQAHQAWRVFRNTECIASADQYRGTPDQGLAMTVCLMEMSTLRADMFEEMLAAE